MQEQDRTNTESTAPFPSEISADTEPFQEEARTQGEIKSTDIARDEIIDRSVQLNPQHFRWGSGNDLRISASAFNDRFYEPSFYRERLCDDPPHKKPPRMNPDDAVASVTVGAIRDQSPITFQSGNDSKPTEHKIDVRPETDGHHKAHVVVFTTPEFKTKGGFARLKELLALIVGGNWAIPPDEAFLKENTNQIPRR